MSAEHGGAHGNEKFRARDAVGFGAELGGLGAIAYGATELVAAAALWPIAIGGALFLLGRGIIKSGRKNKSGH